MTTGGDLAGFPRSARARSTGVGALSTPGQRCSHSRLKLSGCRLPLLSGQSCTPASHPTSGAADDEASKDLLTFTRPVFPSPVAPGWSGDPWAFPLKLPTPPSPATPVEVGTGPEHWPGTTPSTSVDPPICESTHTVRPRVARFTPAQQGVCWSACGVSAQSCHDRAGRSLRSRSRTRFPVAVRRHPGTATSIHVAAQGGLQTAISIHVAALGPGTDARACWPANAVQSV